MELYLEKEGCGTHIVFDQGELERHLKMGWAKRPDDWLDKKNEAAKVRRLEEVKAEQARLAAELESLEQPTEKRPPGRPRKVSE